MRCVVLELSAAMYNVSPCGTFTSNLFSDSIYASTEEIRFTIQIQFHFRNRIVAMYLGDT